MTNTILTASVNIVECKIFGSTKFFKLKCRKPLIINQSAESVEVIQCNKLGTQIQLMWQAYIVVLFLWFSTILVLTDKVCLSYIKPIITM